ncbi:MAG: RNA polymerase sigma factor [Planctomycetota bacterium]
MLEKAVRGDAASLRALLEQYGPGVRDSLARKIGRQWRSILDADDVMQATYLEAFLQAEQLMARTPAAFIGWLTRIAENNLRDAIQVLEREKRPHPRKRVRPGAEGDSHAALLELLGATSTTPSRDAARHEAAEIIDSAISRLPDDYGKAVRLYDLEGRSASEVAATMNRSEAAVHMLRNRAHQRLRTLLGSSANFFSGSA